MGLVSTVRAGELEPAGYAALLADLKVRVRTSQVRAVRAANTELLALYWSIGRDILTRQEQDGWGAKVVDRLAADLRAAFPDQRGFSRRNLQYMRAFAAAWPEPAFQEAFVHQAGAQLPWRHVTVLLDRLDEPGLRSWYAAAAVEHGWSRNVLEHQIMTGLHARAGAAPSNFATHLLEPDSELAQQLTRDPYVFDHLTLTGRVGERELEQALMDRLQQTLTAFGHGMAFVGRQHRLEVGQETLIVDLLLFSYTQLRFVVVELKMGRFDPAYLGQLGTYVAVVDDQMRDAAQHAPTVGILLCTGGDEHLVRYALGASSSPMAVAGYETLTADQRAGLPDPAQLNAVLEETLSTYQGPATG